MQEKRQSEAKGQTSPIALPSPELNNFEAANGYDFIRLLGRGSQGETWLASDKSGAHFAIKVYDMRLMQSWKDETLLRREVAVLQQIDVGGVPKYYDFIEDSPKYYLVMEYISAPTLQSRIDAGQRPTLKDAKKLLFSLAEILANLHLKLPPIIHRDIKPANIMVDDDYNAWIVDFGVVAGQEQNTFGSTVAGTLGYMAPELMMGRATTAVDIYSLGATMLHFISGKAPYTMDSDGLNINYVPHLPENFPLKFRAILDAMLAPSPLERIASGQELIESINVNDLQRLEEKRPSHITATDIVFGILFTASFSAASLYAVFISTPLEQMFKEILNFVIFVSVVIIIVNIVKQKIIKRLTH